MLKTLYQLLAGGIRTVRQIPERLPDEARGLPRVIDSRCLDACRLCANVCPTDAITLLSDSAIELDLGKCIACSQCIETCAPGVIVKSTDTKTFEDQRNKLLKSNHIEPIADSEQLSKGAKSPFRFSAACRVVSTGCSACDLEIVACNNSIFDMERFGISIVASPRFADIQLVTGPVPRAMHNALRSCYEAMAEPRRVVAVGSCAISGGVHANGYASANGVSEILPVDVYIPGCPPHPWSIVNGVRAVMGYQSLSDVAKSLM